ncbi:MAG: hypothetical protein GX958_07810 [Desulfitobacterium sp.]|nr:hypothetical protein [Desulfitobacterium sp.]
MPKKRFALRLDPKLYNVLEKWAADEFRSVNAHIEFLLREAARKAGRLKKNDPYDEGGD